MNDHELKHLLERIEAKLTEVLTRLNRLSSQGDCIMASIDDVLSDIAAESTIEDSVVSMLTALQAQVTAANGNQAKIDAAFAALETNKAKLSAALVANTPAAPVADSGSTPPVVGA